MGHFEGQNGQKMAKKIFFQKPSKSFEIIKKRYLIANYMVFGHVSPTDLVCLIAPVEEWSNFKSTKKMEKTQEQVPKTT